MGKLYLHPAAAPDAWRCRWSWAVSSSPSCRSSAALDSPGWTWVSPSPPFLRPWLWGSRLLLANNLFYFLENKSPKEEEEEVAARGSLGTPRPADRLWLTGELSSSAPVYWTVLRSVRPVLPPERSPLPPLCSTLSRVCKSSVTGGQFGSPSLGLDFLGSCRNYRRPPCPRVPRSARPVCRCSAAWIRSLSYDYSTEWTVAGAPRAAAIKEREEDEEEGARALWTGSRARGHPTPTQ